MDRPYIICHMATALDGKITGAYMETPEAESASEWKSCLQVMCKVGQLFDDVRRINI